MQKLKGTHSGKDAILITAGPSVVNKIKHLKKIDRQKYVIFLEATALTKRYILEGIEPDYYLMPYASKFKVNTLINFIYQSMKVDVDPKYFLREDHHGVVNKILNNKEKLLQEWNPKKGIHKRIKFKSDLYLEDSHYERVKSFPGCKIIAREQDMNFEYPNLDLPNEIHYFEFSDQPAATFSEYLEVTVKNGKSILNPGLSTNTSAISTFPIMNFMGIKDIYLFGFDGTLFGNFEDNVQNLFKSKLHFYIFYFLLRKAFDFSFKLNFPLYLRPKLDLESTDLLCKQLPSKIYRIVGNDSPTYSFKHMEDVEIDRLL